MNRRQRKKKDAKGLILIFSCEMVCKQETYAKRARVIKNGAVVFADWGYYLKERYQEKGFTGDEIVTDFRAHLDVAHKDWHKLGLMPPLDQEGTPQYIAGDMHINMYYDIYI